MKPNQYNTIAISLGLAIIIALIGSIRTSAQVSLASLQYRDYDIRDMGLSNPEGIAYAPEANLFFVAQSTGEDATRIITVTPDEDFVNLADVDVALAAPVNMSYDSQSARLLLYDPATQQLIALATEPDGAVEATENVVRYDVGTLGLQQAKGMVIDSATGNLYILDSATREIVRLQADASGTYDATNADASRIARIKLPLPDTASLQGLAFHSGNGHLYTVESQSQILYEVSQSGELVASFGLAEMALMNPLGLVAAPSADSTDDPAVVDIYLADSGIVEATSPVQFVPDLFLPWINDSSAESSSVQSPSEPSEPAVQRGRLIELYLERPTDASSAAAHAVARLVKTTNTSAYNPPSTDTSGVAYLGNNTLILADSEIEELSAYRGVNVWTVGLNGVVQSTSHTEPFSDEPTGVAYAESRGPQGSKYLFFTDDRGTRTVYEVNLGADGVYGPNDVVRTFSPITDDPEDVAYDSWNDRLVVVDGIDMEVYTLDPGPNNIFGDGDDTSSHFDVGGGNFGLTDPEGIAFDSVNGHLYILGRNKLAEALTNGTWVRDIDVDAIPSSGIAGITKAPPSTFEPTFPNDLYFYIVDRGVDETPDGRLYEIGFAPLPTNQTAPVVNAGTDQSVVGSLVANLDATITDDGLPNPPGNVTSTWSKISGPGSVTFGNSNTVDTTATFSTQGIYVLRLFATDGQLATFDEVSVLVDIGHLPPAVNAGADMTVAMPNSANLNGTVTDDGLPNPPGSTTKEWSKVSGPGIVTFGNATAEDTTASFSESGVYVLRLSASDSQLSAFDDVTVTVTLPAGTIVFERRISANSDDAEERGGTQNGTVILPGDLEMVFDNAGNQTVGLRFTNIAIPLGATISTAYVQFAVDEATNVATNLNIQGHKIANAPTFTTSGNPNSNITNRPRTTASTAWNPPAWALPVNTAGPAQRTPNIAPVIQEIVSQAQWASGNALALIISGTGERVAVGHEDSAANAALLHIEYTTAPPVNQAPVVNAGNDQTITLPGQASLNGSVSDDGMVNPTPTITWSQVSGDGTATFTNANAAVTSVSFSTAGTYVLRLTGYDGELTTTDDVSITVNPAPVNQAPVVNAGTDQTITLPAQASLTGSVTDDGMVNTTPTATWSQVSGVGTATFTDANAAVTSVSFSAAGTYVLRLTAFDGELTTTDDLSVTVNPPVPNRAPVVNAGNDQTITLPAQAGLSGSVTDDGLVNASPTVTWSQVSGDGTATFTDANAAITSVSFSVAGTYVLRLTAFDGEFTSTDDVSITVNPAPPNLAPVVNAGTDQTITLPAQATLSGSVTDDGKVNPTPTITWSQVSGTGTATFANANVAATSASFSAPGNYVLRLSAFDGELTTTDDVSVTVNAAPAQQTFERRVAASTDDAEQQGPTGSVDLTSSDLELVADGNTLQVIGLRFNTITIPQGATILDAYVQFKVDETSTGTSNITIQGQAADNAAAFTTAAANVSSRPRTTASVNWQPPTWPTVGAITADQRTPNLTAVIQEIVNRPGWASGNSLAIIMTGTGRRAAEAFNGDQAGAPLLHIVYGTVTGATVEEIITLPLDGLLMRLPMISSGTE